MDSSVIRNIQNDLKNQIIQVSESEGNYINSDLEKKSIQFGKNYISGDSEVEFYNANKNSDKSLISSSSKGNPNLIYSKYKKTTAKKNSDTFSVKSYYKGKDLNSKSDDVLLKLNSEIQSLKKQLIQTKGEILTLQEENGFVKLEKEKSAKIKDNEIQLLNEKLIALQTENSKLKYTSEQQKKTLDEYTPKVWKYNETIEKYEKLQKDHDELRESNSNLNKLLNQLKKDTAEASSKYETLRLENDSLKQDKMFLTKNNMLLEEKNKGQMEKNALLEKDIREMRKTNQDYIDKLTDKNLNMDITYKDKVNQELTAMKNKYDQDIESIKRQYDEIMEKKTQYLQEERDEYKSKCTKYEKSLKEKEESINLISTELRNFHTKTNEELADLRLKLSLKTEELVNRSNQCDEQVATLTLFKNENESFKEKNDLLRSELIKKESEFRSEVAELKAQISVLREKIASYDNMEEELDKAIYDGTLDKDNNNEVLDIIKDIPTRSKRRINQCLTLANKLKLMTVENEKMKNMNTQLLNELNITKEQNEIYKSVSDKVKQPYSYLIKNLQENEIEIYKLKSENEKKDQTINRLTKENELYEEKVNAMGADLKTIVGNRQKLADLENVITSFIQNENVNQMNSSSMINNPSASVNLGGYTTGNYMSGSLGMSGSTYANFQKPERDTGMMLNSTTQNLNQSQMNQSVSQSNKIPNWYLKLQAKK